MYPEDPALIRLFKIAARGKWRMALSCILMSLGTLAGMVPFASVYFIARELLVPSGADFTVLVLFWAALALAGIVVSMVLSFAGSLNAHIVAFTILYNIRIHVMAHVGTLPLGFFDRTPTGSVQKTMDDSIEKIEGFVAHLLPDMIASTCAVIALVTGLAIINIWLALTIVIAVAVACFFQMRIWGPKSGQEILTGFAGISAKMTGAFSEYVKGIAEVKLFGRAGSVTQGLKDASREYCSWEMKMYRRVAPFYEAYKTIILSLTAFVLPVGILLIWLSPGDSAVLLAVVMGLIVSPAIVSPFLEMVNYGTRMGELTIALSSIDSILNHEPIPNPYKTISPERYDVEFRDVVFSYQDTSDPLRKNALDSMSFTAPQSQMTALVGPSGGGKSTVGQILTRFWDVDEGKVTIGGVDIRDIEYSKLMNMISFVFQDIFLFSDTVWGNITMNREVSEEMVMQAARSARCHDFIMALPDGYQTKIGSGGLGLSGGEAQRLAIARAIVKDAPIVVLDEALAYSDAENENLIQAAINELIRDRTVIIIAHRLTSIQRARQILVVESGRIVDQGTHESLITRDTLYRQLWNIQQQVDSWSIVRKQTVLEGFR